MFMRRGMITRWLSFSCRGWAIGLLAGLLLVACPVAAGQETDEEAVNRARAYETRLDRYRSGWDRLVPHYFVGQFAGNMGLLSCGVGWDYGRNRRWETEALLGILPAYSSGKTKVTFTLKENFTPWAIPLRKGPFWVEPLSCGLYLNTIFSDRFWRKQPDRYPDGYYEFSTRMRLHAFVGQRLTLVIPEERRFFLRNITLFYEISTCDMLLISAFTNSYLRPRDYLSLSFGLKLQVL